MFLLSIRFLPKVRALPSLHCCPPPALAGLGLWASFLFSLPGIPRWKVLLKGAWFSLQMGPVGHLRLQLDLHANGSVPCPALHWLREGGDAASQGASWGPDSLASIRLCPEPRACPDCPVPGLGLFTPSPRAALAFQSHVGFPSRFPSLSSITFPSPVSFLPPFSQSKANTC